MEEIGSLIARISADDSGFDSKMASAKARLEETGSGFSGVGGAASAAGAEAEEGAGKFEMMGGALGGAAKLAGGLAIAFGAVKIGEMLKDGVEGAADLEVQQRRVNTVFGSGAALVNQFGKESANGYGLSTDAADTMVATLGQTLTSLGENKKQAAGNAVGFAKMASNLAAFTDAKPADVFTALEHGALGATRGLKQYSIDISTADIANQALAMGLVKPIKNTADLQAAQAKLRTTSTDVQKAIEKYGPTSEQAATAEAAHAKASDALQKAMKGTVPALTTEQKSLASMALITRDASMASGDYKKHSTDLAEEQQRLGAEFSNIEDQLGKALLPTITEVGAYLAKNLPGAIVDVQDAFQKAKPDIESVIHAFQEVISFVEAHWSEIDGVIKAQIALWSAEFDFVGDLIHGRWGKIWGDVVNIVKAELALAESEIKLVGPLLVSALETVGSLALKGLETGLSDLPGVLEKAMSALPGVAKKGGQLAASAISAGIKDVVGDLSGLGQSLLTKIDGELKQLAGWVVGEAESIGKAIASGIVSGVGNLGSTLASKIEGAADSAKNSVMRHLHINSPSKVWASDVGSPIGEGIIYGFLMGSADLPSKISQTLSNALEAAKNVVQAKQSTLTSAFSQLGSDVDSAFDAATSAGLAKIAAKGANLTPAEKQLQALQNAHDAAGLQNTLTSAQGQLSTDTASGADANTIASDTQAVSDAQYAITIAGLQKTADAQRAARDKETAKKQLNYQASRDLQKRHLDAMLADLNTELAKEPTYFQKHHETLMKWLDKVAGPDLKSSGKNLGLAFATGLEQDDKAIGSASEGLAKTVAKYLKLSSPAEKGPLSSLDSWWTAMPKTLLSGVDTKQLSDITSGVTSPGLGAALATSGAGGGGWQGDVYLTVQGSVMTEKDLVNTVRDGFVKVLRSNPNILGTKGPI